jgi:hypothetical protein
MTTIVQVEYRPSLLSAREDTLLPDGTVLSVQSSTHPDAEKCVNATFRLS